MPMCDDYFNFPEWQVPLQELITEPDPERFRSKREAVENLLLERLIMLGRTKDGRDEYQALNYSMSILRMIERDRLKPSYEDRIWHRGC